MPEVVIIAALRREVGPLVKNARRGPGGIEYYLTPYAVVACGGIGGQAARQAAEAVVRQFRPDTVISAGFAGGLDPSLRTADVVTPARVVDAETGAVFETEAGDGALVTASRVLTASEKNRLRVEYDAAAVDMEAAAVAGVCAANGIKFLAVKAIMDDGEMSLPPFTAFINSRGQFQTAKYLAHIAVRPWTWRLVFTMGRNSARASAALCARLEGACRRGRELAVSRPLS